MPIYAYRCASCGHAQDVLQKMSDPVLTVCPACGTAAYAKQLTAAGFQLKGSGWYVTDFRGGNTTKPAAAEGEGATPADKGAADKPAADKPAADARNDARSDANRDANRDAKSEVKSEANSESKTAAAPAPAAPAAPAAAPPPSSSSS